MAIECRSGDWRRLGGFLVGVARSLSSIGAERRRWLAAVLPSRSIGVAAAASAGCPSATRHTGQCRGEHGAHSTTASEERERVRAFLKRDSRTGADTPPHPRILRLALPLPLAHSLTFSFFLCRSSPAAYLPLSLARSLSRVRPFPRSPSSPSPSVPTLPRAASRRLLSTPVRRPLTPALANQKSTMNGSDRWQLVV